MFPLRKNQKEAIQASLNSDFESGVFLHATGTGKSWIGLELVKEYNKINSNCNILWLCEKKNILSEQFNKDTIKHKGYSDIFKKFFVINYSENKPTDWHDRINNAAFWKKPILVVINRSFLVSKEKYKHLKIRLDMIIHDECHTIKNITTQNFYKYILEKYPSINCLGFSATPSLDIEPYTKIIHQYSIYDAFCDGVILPPKIKWIKSEYKLDDDDIIKICQSSFKPLHYKKIIVWCGIIEKCYSLAELWKKKFSDYSIFIDTSKDNDNSYEKYSDKEYNSILFCASKHREGSDILNLDCEVFLDKVENRSTQTFIQCIGRTLRLDKNKNKKYGLILDLNASSCIKICDRMNTYIKCTQGFPWKYWYTNNKVNFKKIIIHNLLLQKPVSKIYKEIHYSIDDLQSKFIRDCPDSQIYTNRLQYELNMIQSKNLSSYILRAVEILELTHHIPHVTRGSCGSSLVCFLLGISNVDPIKLNISFARFLNEFRDNLPDIDFDFPHYLRDEVFLKLELKWPNQVARISNHVHWHEKSALREALRKLGYHQQIPKDQLHKFINTLPKNIKESVIETKKSLEDTFRHYSLHCGGIIFFHHGIPPELIINTKTLSQIVYDKHDVSKTKNFKIDILSSRGMSQLIDICGQDIDFDDCPYDEKTYQLLTDGNNIGITLAESPLMRKALMTVKPKSIKDIAICLAIIRPAAKDTRKLNDIVDYDTSFIFDDDAISFLAKELSISESLADKYRRCLAKNKWNPTDKADFKILTSKLPLESYKKIDDFSKNLRLYGFCKAHSYSYAQLVYKLAYQKAHNPKKFWHSTLKYIKSSYRKWVHIYEASLHGVYPNQKDLSLYALARLKKKDDLNIFQQISKYGIWDIKSNPSIPFSYFYLKNDVYYFSGMVAYSRMISKKPPTYVVLLGVQQNKYIELNIKKYFNPKNIFIKGSAELTNPSQQIYSTKFVKSF